MLPGVGRRKERDDAVDARLVVRVRGGDATAFEELVRRHLSGAYALAYRLLGQREDAEDAVQDAFALLVQRLDAYDVARPFAPWFYRIVANRSANVRSARAVRRTEALGDDVAAAGGADAAERAEIRDRFRAAAEALTEEQRMIVELFEVDGFSGAEIGELLEMPAGTVRWHLHEARRALRRALADLKDGEER